MRRHTAASRRGKPDRRLEHRFTAEQIAWFADDCGRDGRGEQIAGYHPGLVAGPAEIGDDRGQRGGDDRLVQCRQHHPEQHRDEDQIPTPDADVGVMRILNPGGHVIESSQCCAGPTSPGRSKERFREAISEIPKKRLRKGFQSASMPW